MKIISALMMLLTAITGLTGQSGLLTPEKLWAFGRVGLEDVSRDGKKALYMVTTYDIPSNKGTTELYLLATSGGTPVKISEPAGSKGNARFLPDGSGISFLLDDKLWVADGNGKNARQVSDQAMNGFAWSPDNQHILFTADVKYFKEVKDIYPDLPLAKARILDDLFYRHWKTWDDYQRSNIFVAAYQNGKTDSKTVNIMQGEPYDTPIEPDGGMEQIAWSADSRYIAYSCRKLNGTAAATSTNSDIYLYDMTTGKTENISDGMPGYDLNPAFSPDGKYITWNSQERAGFEADRVRIFMADLKTKQKRDLTAGFDQHASNVIWSPDSKCVYFIGTDFGTHQIYKAAIEPAKVEKITDGVFDYNGLAYGDGALIASRMSMSMPTEIYRVDEKKGTATQLTFTNQSQLASLKMGEVRKRFVTTTDGKQMLAWVIYPPDFDPAKKYPALLYCQGGPQSSLSQFFSYRWNFQLMAANGYIVVAPCRRGMPGFGQAWNDEISVNWGDQAMKDLLSAIDDVKKEPYVDSDRLGAIGASFGGYAVYWLAGNHQGRFKTFIAHCGMFNTESWYGTTEELWFANWDMGGPYWNEPQSKMYTDYSPNKFVGNWDTPILVIHCEKDFRVPISEGIQAFQAAQLRHIPSRFLYIENEGHWVTQPQNSILWQRVFFEWLARDLKK